jgi:SM-20-related protein
MQTSQSKIEWPVRNMDAAIDALASAHYAVIPNFLSANMQQALHNELLQRQEDGFFHGAGIGRGTQQARNVDIRGDSICWLETDFDAGGQYLQRMDELRQQLNQAFFLGLQSFEGHYAHYQAGSYYQRHVDRHRDNDARVVSAVCYLNQDWPDDAGGELKLWNADNELLVSMPPQGGTLVLFMSADMPHEVLAASRSRYSIAGWFRRDVGS